MTNVLKIKTSPKALVREMKAKSSIILMAEKLGYIREGWRVEDYIKAAVKGISEVGERKGIKVPGFEGIAIWGKMGTLKSNLALQLSYSVYKDWNEVLENLILTEEDMIRLYEKTIDSKEIIPVVIFDDITTSLPKQLWFFHKKRYSELHRMIATVRKNFSCIITTSPLLTNIILPIQETLTMEIVVFPKGFFVVERYMWLPSGRAKEQEFKKILIEKREIDPTVVPKDVFMRYDERRNMVAKAIIEGLKEQYDFDK